MVAARIRSLSEGERRALNARICEAVLRSRLYRDCARLLMYIPLADEVGVLGVREKADSDGKPVYVPVLSPDGRRGEFRRWLPGASARRGARNTWEPSSQPDEEVVEGIPSLVLVPGRAFTRDGRRLGRGAGCYDRWLPWLSSLGDTVGVAYGCQLEDELPEESHDQRVEYLVTEDGLIECRPTSHEC